MEDDKKTKKLKRRLGFKGINFYFGADADNDWSFFGRVFFFLFLIVVTINTVVFFLFVLQSQEDKSEDVKFEVIDQAKLLHIIKTFENKALEFERLKSEITPAAALAPLVDQTPKTDIVWD